MAPGGKKLGRATSGGETQAEKAADTAGGSEQAKQAAPERKSAKENAPAASSNCRAVPSAEPPSKAATSASSNTHDRKRQRAARSNSRNTPAAVRAASDFSTLERLPDELLKRIISFLGIREVWGACRLSLVSRRVREVVASMEFDALVLRGQRIGLSRYRDLRESELRSWALRVRSGALRLAGGALEIDLWRPSQSVTGPISDGVRYSFWPSKPFPSPAKAFLSFASSIQGLRRFVAWHGDIGPPGGSSSRHEYAGELLEALAPVAGTLEELSIRIQYSIIDERRRLPQMSDRSAIVAGLRRLTALRSLDLADCIGFSAELLDEVAPALARLRSFRLAGSAEFRNTVVIFYDREIEYVYTPPQALAAAVERLCPLLEELRIAFGNAYLDSDALEPLCRLPNLRTVAISGRLHALPKFASSKLEELEIDTGTVGQYFEGPAIGQDIEQIGSLRALSLYGSWRRAPDWSSLFDTTALRSLTIGPPASKLPREIFEPAPDCFALVPHLAALERLSVHFSTHPPPALAHSLATLASALPFAPSLRSLLVHVSFTYYASSAPRLDPALGASAAALLRAAKDTLEEYDRDMVYPSVQESEALAACTRLRRASLTLAEPAWTVAESAAGLAALAPLASMAARPAPAQEDLVLLRDGGDFSNWGPVRARLGGRWRLE